MQDFLETCIKVSKSRNQFLELSILPKRLEKTILSSGFFFSWFVGFFGRIENSKPFFEIYWPIAIFLVSTKTVIFLVVIKYFFKASIDFDFNFLCLSFSGKFLYNILLSTYADVLQTGFPDWWMVKYFTVGWNYFEMSILIVKPKSLPRELPCGQKSRNIP